MFFDILAYLTDGCRAKRCFIGYGVLHRTSIQQETELNFSMCKSFQQNYKNFL